MKKYTVCAAVSSACYGVFFLSGAVCAAVLWSLLKSVEGSGAEGVGAVVSAVVAAAACIFCAAYAAVSTLPLVLRLFSLKTEKKLFPALCIVFDVVFIAANVFAVFCVTGGARIVGAALTAVSAVSLAANITALKKSSL